MGVRVGDAVTTLVGVGEAAGDPVGVGETLALAVSAGVADTESFGVGVSCIGTGVSVGTGGSMPESDRSSK